jgi:hypothetical protein
MRAFAASDLRVAVAVNPTALLAPSRDRPIDSFNGLSIDSSIGPSIDPAATALAPGLVSRPLRHHATVRAARQIDPLPFSVGKSLEQRAADRLVGLAIIGFVGGSAFTHVEHLVLPAIRPNVQRKSIEPAAGAFTLLHRNRNQPGRRRRRRAIWEPPSCVSSPRQFLDAPY